MTTMRRQALRFALALAFLVLSGPRPGGTDLGPGWQAYQRGDYAAAASAWRPLAETGDAAAQYNLGVLYDEGLGVERDDETALLWWTRAAQQDHRLAQHNLALTLLERGGPLDLAEAVTWLERAAATGFARSQYSLAKLYAAGQGVEPDDDKAFALMLEAGQAGFVRAQYNLGKMYRDAQGVDQDLAAASGWFRHAAEQGYAKAQVRLANRYLYGQGVALDLVEALTWATLAVAQGEDSARETRSLLLDLLDETQVAEAERRADAFQPKPAAPIAAD